MKRYLLLALGLLFSCGLGTPALAQDTSEEEAIRQRMLERVDAIDALKKAGKVGENNVGLLEQRAPLSEEERELMNAENADRRALYTIIAKRLGLTTTVVGQGRAEELRKKSAPGVWLEDRGGNWYQKEG